MDEQINTNEKKEIKWELLEPGSWKPQNAGDEVAGVFIAKKENVGINKSNVYYLENKDGPTMIWGSTVLDDRMTIAHIGDHIQIKFLGTQENTRGQPTKLFEVRREIKE